MRAAAIAAVIWAAGVAACSRAGPPRDASTPALTMRQPVDHVGVLTREPMLAEHRGGALFVAGYGAPAPVLWKSADRGATWSRVNVGPESSGAIGNSDVDLAVARDGTLYFASMVFDNKALEGVSISVGVSHDAGATWTWTPLSTNRYDNRPWVDVAPDGAAHVIWNDGAGVRHAVSRDGGRTWSAPARIHPAGGIEPSRRRPDRRGRGARHAVVGVRPDIQRRR